MTPNPLVVDGVVVPPRKGSATIHDLPPELLTHILLIAAQKHAGDGEMIADDDLRCLCRVCSHWCHIVLQCPPFWTYFYGESELDWIKLQRSKNASLNVFLLNPGDAELARILPHMHRCEHVLMHGSEDDLSYVFGSPMPRLRSLKIAAPHIPHFDTLAIGHALDLGGLHRVKLREIIFQNGVSGLGPLTKLSLENIDTRQITCRSLVDVVRNSPGLEKLKLRNVQYPTPLGEEAELSSSTSTVALPQLDYLCLVDVPQPVINCVLANIDAYKLTRMRLSSNTSRAVEWSGQNILRYLTRPMENGESMISTVVRGPWPERGRPRLLLEVNHCPLKLGYDEEDNSLDVEIWSLQQEFPIKDSLLALKNTTIPIRLIVDATSLRNLPWNFDFLACLPSITHLELYCEWDEAKPIIEYLSFSRTTDGLVQRTCPNLKEVWLMASYPDEEYIGETLEARRFANPQEGRMHPLEVTIWGERHPFNWDLCTFDPDKISN